MVDVHTPLPPTYEKEKGVKSPRGPAIGMALVVTRRIDRMKIASRWNKRGAGYGTTGGVQA